MNKKPSDNSSPKGPELNEEPIAGGRRKAVRSILAGSSITAVAAAGNWSKPVLDAVILPAHAQTSAVSVTLAGNVSSSPTASYTAPKQNSVLDFFVGSAYAQTSGLDLGGACLTMAVEGNQFSATLEFVADPAITLDGTVSDGSFSASGSGVTISGTFVSDATSTASGTVSNSNGTFNFSIDSATSSCEPIAPTTTPAPTTTAAPTTTVAPTTTIGPTTTMAPTTTPSPTTTPT